MAAAANNLFKERGLIYSGTDMNNLDMGIWNRYSGDYSIPNKPPYNSFVSIVLKTGSYIIQIAYNNEDITKSVRRIYINGNWSSWQ